MEKAGDILKNIIQSLFERSELQKGEEYHNFFASWEKIMGLKLSQHSKPIEVKEHFLLIEVDHPGWLQLIQMNEKIIIRRIKTAYPQLGIDFIKIILKTNTAQKQEQTPQKYPEKELRDLIHDKFEKNIDQNHEIIESIADASLRDSMRRLYNNIRKKKDES